MSEHKKWWWRQHPKEKSNRVAFDYELQMRKRGKKRFKTYMELDEIAQLHLKLADSMKPTTQFIFQSSDTPSRKPEEGWSPYLCISWNLNAAPKTLARAFTDLLDVFRKKNGTRATMPPSRKKPAWRVLELFDRKASGERLDESERSQLSKWFRV